MPTYASLNNMLTMTIWNSNGLARQAVSQVTDSLLTSSMIFMTETWLLSPLRFPTDWKQYHTYGQPVEGTYRGKMGITLLINPSFAYPVTHFPSDFPYVLTCQVSSLLIHCVYLPPSLTDTEAIDILQSLPTQTHPSQTNTIICGDFNARHHSLLGDTRTTTRGTLMLDWIMESGIICWNHRLAFGIPTYSSQARRENTGYAYTSIIDLFLSFSDLVHPQLQVREDLSMGSDHHPVTLSCILPTSPPPSPHPRFVWNLSRMQEPDCLYGKFISERMTPFKEHLLTFLDPCRASYNSKPNFDELAATFTGIIHSSLDDSVGRRVPKNSNHIWFWTPELQSEFDYRERCRLNWKRAAGIDKVGRWDTFIAACRRFKIALQRRRRATWKQFCQKLSSGPLHETTSIIRKIRRNRSSAPQFAHPEGPLVAAQTMADHFQQVFSGAFLPPHRYQAPPIPDGPHPVCPSSCPIDSETVREALVRRLARRKAPGIDQLRTEMLLVIVHDVVPVLTALFQLCWRWSSIPTQWCVAQIVPIYKKGDPLDPANFRPISLTSILRKLFELCLQSSLEDTAPPLDIVQGGFRRGRSALDQALCLHELCRQHTEDHFGEPPVLAFLDIKSAYDTVDRAVIWRALETHVSEPMLGILQSLFDNVSVQVLLGGNSSRFFWPRTGVLQGSILSPFLYSIYINSLPSTLRSVSMPTFSRVFNSMPRFEHNGLWINSLLYADDVVLIGAPETMPRLLRAAEDHSRSLGYKWNPAKCVILNPPNAHGARPLKLYGTAMPSSTSFAYLGIPFSNKGAIDTKLLLQRNVASGLAAMRNTLQVLGLLTPSFSRLTTSRLYATFVRPCFEYGLCLCVFTTKDLETLEKGQDFCLRIAFGGHKTTSTAVFKHITNLPSTVTPKTVPMFCNFVFYRQLCDY
ncbi:hypothetical protein G6F46_011333 [Rhizopus delemar]|nr:hypothetical protein G6F54_011065 [Rhizopus delemar]KAG1500468.1 hypothetical protein G6F53_011299 [Rhizopus delemar]KAG1578802.1 hypothetical protein G6F48_011648 [Rhizopus delemar]KAG1583913.1 hypothetical protein G6F47_011868 [Rhizopus delemar]KAG1608731.1 hypothetical protein G6F46_011333 [Rhizopus delemar]